MAARSMKGTMLAAVAVIVAATLWTGAVAQSSSGCTNVLVSMSPCLDYIQGNSSKPTSSCCSSLANVVKSNPECLCEVLNGGGSSFGITVNQTQAEALPTDCNVKTPPTSQCSASSPSGTSNSPSGDGSKTVPSTNDGTSAGNSNKLSWLFFLVLAASSIYAI